MIILIMTYITDAGSKIFFEQLAESSCQHYYRVLVFCPRKPVACSQEEPVFESLTLGFVNGQSVFNPNPNDNKKTSDC